MQVNIEIDMQFSTEVFDRTRALLFKYSRAGIPLPVANKIFELQNCLEIYNDMQLVSPINASKWLEKAKDCELALEQAGITDDRTAIEYLDSIEPKYAVYLEMHSEITGRHKREWDDFTASLP